MSSSLGSASTELAQYDTFRYTMISDEETTICQYISDKSSRTIIYDNLVNQMYADPNLSQLEKIAFCTALKELEVMFEWAFDHHYNEKKVLMKIIPKIFKALNGKHGAMQIEKFAFSIRDVYMNEVDMQGKMR